MLDRKRLEAQSDIAMKKAGRSAMRPATATEWFSDAVTRTPMYSRTSLLATALADQGDILVFEICKSMNGGYWWRLLGTNGEVLCHSEQYTAKQSAQNGIAAVKRIAPNAITRDLT